MRVEAYQNNILFSCVTGTDKTLKHKKRDYFKVKKELFKDIYDSKGNLNKNTIGLYFDQRI